MVQIGFAQVSPTPPPPPPLDDVIEINTRLIDVPVSVSDAKGAPVLKLAKENFELFEDGKKQEIESFIANDKPFEVALLLDTSGSTRSELRLVKRAAKLFLNSLRPGDRVAIIGFRTEIEGEEGTRFATPFAVVDLVSNLTENRTILNEAIEKVSTSNGTPYYDALSVVAEKVFDKPASKEFVGRRALVALTDGVDSTSAAGFEEASELLEEKGVASYFIKIDTQIEFEDSLLGDCSTSTQFSKAQMRRYYNLFPKEFRVQRTTDFCRLGNFERLDISKRLYELANKEMNAIAKKSGGRVIPVDDLSEARRAFRQVAKDIGTSYSLGYYSTNANKDGAFRKIEVRLKGLPKGATVRAREGYVADK